MQLIFSHIICIQQTFIFFPFPFLASQRKLFFSPLYHQPQKRSGFTPLCLMKNTKQIVRGKQKVLLCTLNIIHNFSELRERDQHQIFQLFDYHDMFSSSKNTEFKIRLISTCCIYIKLGEKMKLCAVLSTSICMISPLVWQCLSSQEK